MTQAVCIFCGAIKFGGFSPCESCLREPATEDEYATSLLLTDHYYDIKALEAIGNGISNGKTLEIDPATKEQLVEAVRVLGIF